MVKSICLFCKEEFSRNSVLNRHLGEKRCNVDMINLHKIHKELTEKINSLTITGNNNNNTTTNNNITINIHVNDIASLDTSYIDPAKIRDLVSKYNDKNLNLLLGDYIKEIICNKDHPENHAVKYLKKKPPTFKSLVKDNDGKLINVVKDLKDTCELLESPILEKLKVKLKDYLTNFKEDPEYDRIKAKDIWEELKNGAVTKALSSVLKNDILNDLEMKFIEYG